jgi:hypothetical protein
MKASLSSLFPLLDTSLVVAFEVSSCDTNGKLVELGNLSTGEMSDWEIQHTHKSPPFLSQLDQFRTLHANESTTCFMPSTNHQNPLCFLSPNRTRTARVSASSRATNRKAQSRLISRHPTGTLRTKPAGSFHLHLQRGHCQIHIFSFVANHLSFAINFILYFSTKRKLFWAGDTREPAAAPAR